MKICKKKILQLARRLIQNDLDKLSIALENDYDCKNKTYCFKYSEGQKYSLLPKINNIRVESISIFPLGTSKVWYKNIKKQGYKYYVLIEGCITVPFFRYKNAVKYLNMWKDFLTEYNQEFYD